MCRHRWDKIARCESESKPGRDREVVRRGEVQRRQHLKQCEVVVKSARTEAPIVDIVSFCAAGVNGGGTGVAVSHVHILLLIV